MSVMYSGLKVLRNFSTHPFKLKTPNSSQILAKELVNNILYNKEGVIALNKPYGISFNLSDKKNDNDYEVSLSSMLPYLEQICEQRLFKVKSPEKYNSGVSIFCSNEKYAVKLKNKLSFMKQHGVPMETYLAIAIGKPRNQIDYFTGAITLQTNGSKEKKAVLITKWTKSKLMKGLVKRISISHKMLGTNNLASLIQIKTTKNNWHCLRIYLTSKTLSPLLGDNIYGSMVKSILGVPVLLDPFSPVSSIPQEIPERLQEVLQLISRKDIQIPAHLHLNEVLIKNFRKEEDLVISAPLPDYFKWTLQQLRIIDPNKNGYYVPQLVELNGVKEKGKEVL